MLQVSVHRYVEFCLVPLPMIVAVVFGANKCTVYTFPLEQKVSSLFHIAALRCLQALFLSWHTIENTQQTIKVQY